MGTSRAAWLASTAVILAAGCRPPTHPTFAPIGESLAFTKGAKGSDLYVQTGSNSKLAARNIQGDVAWSPDGKDLAVTPADRGHDRTEIIRLAGKGAVFTNELCGPFAWTPWGLAGVATGKPKPDRTGLARIGIVDPSTGKLRRTIEAPFPPGDLLSLGQKGLLGWTDLDTWFWDGRRVETRPELSLFDPVSVARGGESVLFARKWVPAHTHRQRVELLRWRPGQPNVAPQRVATLDFEDHPHAYVFVMDVAGASDGTLAVALVRCVPRPEDEEELLALVDQFDLLNTFGQDKGADADGEKQAEDRVSHILERSDLRLDVMAKRPHGAWVMPFEKRISADGGSTLFIDVSPDGRRLAVTTDYATHVLPLR